MDAAEDQRPAPTVHRGELISATSALCLLLVMFLFEWYGVAGVPDPSAARPAVTSAENAWTGLPVVRWVMLLTIAVTLGSVVLHASQRTHGTRTDTSGVVTVLGSLTAVLLCYRVLISLPAGNQVIDQKLGAVLGLVCALGIALGGYESTRERQARAAKVMRASRARLASRRRAR
jgi:hypothetical protein